MPQSVKIRIDRMTTTSHAMPARQAFILSRYRSGSVSTETVTGTAEDDGEPSLCSRQITPAPIS